MNEELDKLNLLSIELLEFFGNAEPSEEQIASMERLLTNSYVCNKITFNERLSKREKMCLQLAANGESTESTAKILKISTATVATHRKRIRQKLMAKTMGQAIYAGVRYGWINQIIDAANDYRGIPSTAS